MDIDEFLESEGTSDVEKGGRKELVEKQAAEFITDLSIEAQINKIRELIQARHYKDAEKVYFSVKEQYATLAKRQEEARRKIHRELTAINKELLERLDMIKKEMEQKTLIISDLLQRAQQYMLNGETEKANQLYLQVREIFKALPDAFAERKMILENQILTFYSQLVNEFNKKNYGRLLEKRDEIMRNIEIATNQLKLGNVELTKKQYNHINKLYNELPEGFLYEKTIIYKRILALHQMIDEGIYHEIKPSEVVFGQQMPVQQTVPPPAENKIVPPVEVPVPDAVPAQTKRRLLGFLQRGTEEQKGENKDKEKITLPKAVIKPKRVIDAPPLPI